MRVLFVEDIEESIIPSRRLLEKNGFDCFLTNFGDVTAQLQSVRPDIVVLDLMEGSSEDPDPGKSAYHLIWETRFCPVIIYSSNPDLFEHAPHIFVADVKKGSGTEDKILEKVTGFDEHMRVINETQLEVDKVIGITLRDIAPLIFDGGTGIEIPRDKALQYLGRRRIAVMMDEHIYDEMEAWGQYIWPPMGSSIKLGDVIKVKKADQSPESFMIVLSPSCDLVCDGGRSPKVGEVLIACCENSKALFEKAEVVGY